MQITSEIVKKLRDRTGAGMMDCKRALESTGGEMEKAIEFLRKKGAAVGAKRADRSAKEGVIVTRISPDRKRGVAVEINCETDFVGRSDDFTRFADVVAQAVEQNSPAAIEQLNGLVVAGKSVAEHQNDILAKVGEKIDVRRFQVMDAAAGAVSAYTHMGSKIGVLVEVTGPIEKAASVGREIAMQVAAMNPSVVTRDQVDKTAVERELEVYKALAKNEGKPEHILEKIATGRLEKYYQEVCLAEQTYIKDGTKTVKDVIQEAGTEAGAPLSIVRFIRFQLGEEAK